MIIAIFEKEHKAEASSAYYVHKVEIRALCYRTRWASPSNYIGLDIYFNNLGQICIPTSGLSACSVSIFLTEPLCTSY